MTEAECDFLWRQQSLRKQTLFAVAVIRRLPRLADFPVSVSGLQFVEVVADLDFPTVPHMRQLKSLRLRTQRRMLELYRSGDTDEALSTVSWLFQIAASFKEEGYFFGFANYLLRQNPGEGSRADVCPTGEIVNEVFGNPFCPSHFDPRWQSETAIALAAGIYSDRAFDRLPILADALEDAGCDNADILTHCRSDGPHVRGCWVVDLVLGKE